MGYFNKDVDGHWLGTMESAMVFTVNLSGIVVAGLTTAKSKYNFQSLYLSMLDQQFMIGRELLMEWAGGGVL